MRVVANAAWTRSMHACALSGLYLRVPVATAAAASSLQAFSRNVWQAVGSIAQVGAIWHSSFALAAQNVATSGNGFAVVLVHAPANAAMTPSAIPTPSQ